MANKPRVYWDACAWISLINEEEDRIEACKYFIAQAEKGAVEIWTSAFTLAEVFKRKCGDDVKGLGAEQDRSFEDFLMREFVVRVQVDVQIGQKARQLLRDFPQIGKPQDAIHLATAVVYNLDVLHTFDHDDLLALDGQIARADGEMLQIKTPEIPPEELMPLFEGLEEQ